METRRIETADSVGDGLVTGEGEAEEWGEKCPTFQLSTERRQ